MTKENFLNKFKKVIQDKNVDWEKREEGSLNNLSDIDRCAFPGIYVILQGENVIYIGSAYAGDRSVAVRLKQYLSNSKTGNTLAKAFVRNKDVTFNKAKKLIKKCRFMAFKYQDLEY